MGKKKNNKKEEQVVEDYSFNQLLTNGPRPKNQFGLYLAKPHPFLRHVFDLSERSSDPMCITASEMMQREQTRRPGPKDFCFSTALGEMRSGAKVSRRNWAEDEYISIGDIDCGDGNVYSGLVHNLRQEQYDPTQADIMAQNWYVHPGYIVEQKARREYVQQDEIRREV